MTEADWLRETEPDRMALYLRDRSRVNRTKSGRRKLRLFGCGCCRMAWHLFVSEKVVAGLVEMAERLADGEALQSSIDILGAKLPATPGKGTRLFAVVAAQTVASSNAMLAGEGTAGLLAQGEVYAAGDHSPNAGAGYDRGRQADLLRCIFGNPFRPVALDPQWLTSTVVQLARGIYDDRAFDRLPILADALQDAGCDNGDVLNHCRGAGPHARGCWVVDLVLGKS